MGEVTRITRRSLGNLGSEKSRAENLLAALLSADGILFEQQFRFSPDRQWKADFLIHHPPSEPCQWDIHPLARTLIVEVVGTTGFENPRTGKNHLGGHQTAKGMTKDFHRAAEMMLLGYRLLNVTEPMIKDGSAIEYIKRYFKEIRP